MFCRSLFVLFLLVIVLSVLLRYTDSDYSFAIFNLFLMKHMLFFKKPLKSVTRHVNLVINPMGRLSNEWGKDREVFTTSSTYPWLFVTYIFHNGQPSHDDFNLSKRNHWFSSFLVSRINLHVQIVYNRTCSFFSRTLYIHILLL
jgi:hypothetical protein